MYGIPRESGDDPERIERRRNPQSVFPARAGMIPKAYNQKALEKGIPRESGDDPQSGRGK